MGTTVHGVEQGFISLDTLRTQPLFSDPGYARDPYVKKIGNKWYYYYTKTRNEIDHRSVVAVREGTDLFYWSGPAIAYVQPYRVRWGGDAESSTINEKDGVFCLFICRANTECNRTDVYRSKNPQYFPRENL